MKTFKDMNFDAIVMVATCAALLRGWKKESNSIFLNLFVKVTTINVLFRLARARLRQINCFVIQPSASICCKTMFVHWITTMRCSQYWQEVALSSICRHWKPPLLELGNLSSAGRRNLSIVWEYPINIDLRNFLLVVSVSITVVFCSPVLSAQSCGFFQRLNYFYLSLHSDVYVPEECRTKSLLRTSQYVRINSWFNSSFVPQTNSSATNYRTSAAFVLIPT